ncbi:MAG TPA: transcriptional regulator, partial [Ruminococcaceae bacterium]|nr:transcriptional regulator [Oscillospiraceae bacterium]
GADGLKKDKVPSLSPEKLDAEFPLFSSSLFNLIQNSEARMGVKKRDK